MLATTMLCINPLVSTIEGMIVNALFLREPSFASFDCCGHVLRVFLHSLTSPCVTASGGCDTVGEPEPSVSLSVSGIGDAPLELPN